MLIGYTRGQSSVIVRVKILDSSASTGAGKTGLSHTTASLLISTIADNEAAPVYYSSTGSPSEIETIATLGTYAAPSTGACRFKEVDATRHKGVYELQFANARFAVANAKSLLISISGPTNAAETDVVIPLRDDDPYNATSGGHTNLDTTVSSRASQTSVDTIDDFVDSEVAAIKAKTDQLTFTVANVVDANIQRVNDVVVTGTGASGDEWGP